jgi:hypothetical protein
MNGRSEQRLAIIFFFKAGLSVTEPQVLVQKAYGNETLNRSSFEMEGSWQMTTREMAIQN